MPFAHDLRKTFSKRKCQVHMNSIPAATLSKFSTCASPTPNKLKKPAFICVEQKTSCLRPSSVSITRWTSASPAFAIYSSDAMIFVSKASSLLRIFYSESNKRVLNTVICCSGGPRNFRRVAIADDMKKCISHHTSENHSS